MLNLMKLQDVQAEPELLQRAASLLPSCLVVEMKSLTRHLKIRLSLHVHVALNQRLMLHHVAL